MTTRALTFVLVLLAVILCAAALAAAAQRREAMGGAGSSERDARYTHTLHPAGTGPHSHLAALDESGTGESTRDFGHSHPVQALQVLPAGPDRHIHDISRYVINDV